MIKVCYSFPFVSIELAVQRFEEGTSRAVCHSVDCHALLSHRTHPPPSWPYLDFEKLFFVGLSKQTWFAMQIMIHVHTCGMILKVYTVGTVLQKL
jgi:hypothetical protein